MTMTASTDIIIGTPPAQRGRPTVWRERMRIVERSVADGLRLEFNEWIVFASGLHPKTGRNLGQTMRKLHPGWEWTTSVTNDLATVWCRPKAGA